MSWFIFIILLDGAQGNDWTRRCVAIRIWGHGKDTIQNVIVNNNSVINITLDLPAGKCHQKTNSKKCPIDGKFKYVIPILYGLPKEKTMRKVKKGKIKLGGCEVTGCEPNWFCKEHNKEF